MLVFGTYHVGYRVQVLTNQLTQDAGTRTMKNANTRHTYQYGIVEEMHHGVQSLVTTHASDIYVLMEILLPVFYRRACHLRGLNSQVGMLIG